MRSFKTEGIVIKRRDFRDADKILTVFTKNHGKMQIKAAGIRRIPSRRSPHVELLNYTVLTLYKGNSLPVLTEAQALEHFAPIKSDLIKIGFAYHICELVDSLCPDNQENRQVFFLLKGVLNNLSQGENPSIDLVKNAMPSPQPSPQMGEGVIGRLSPQISGEMSRTSSVQIEDRIKGIPSPIWGEGPRQGRGGEGRAVGDTYYASSAPQPLTLHDKSSNNNEILTTIHDFEVDLLSTLGYWDKSDALSAQFDTHTFIENLIERKLKSRNLFAKLQ